MSNNLSPAEVERLSILAEECSEVIQMVGKILRHGYESVNPLDPTGCTNRQHLEKEIGDVQIATELMLFNFDLYGHSITEYKSDKIIRMQKWMHYNNVEVLLDAII